MCVFWNSLCSKFLNWETILRDFCVDWIIGWVVCWIAFISVLFTSRKTVLKSWLNTSLIPCYMSSFSSIFLKRNLDISSIASGSIEKAPASSIAPQHLLDWSSFCFESNSLLLDNFLNTLAIEDQILDTYLNRYLDTFICRDLLVAYIRPLCNPNFISFLSLSILLCFSPKTISSYSKLVPQGFFKLFQVSPYLVSSLSFLIHAFHDLKPRFWGFWKILRFFKIDELSLKFWDGFSLKCV